MYVIVIYDVESKKCNKLHKYLKRKLNWTQNSIFEGDITKAERVIIKNDLKKLINPKEDSVIIYDLPDKRWINREILGKERNPHQNII